MKVGIIGAGRIGVVHAENIMHSIPEIELKTIAEARMTDAIKSWATDLKIPNITTDPEDIFMDSEIDAVLICSSTDTHADFIVRCAQTGKHIFCEKPIDRDMQKIKKALEAVEEAGVKIQIGFCRRFDHNHKRVADIVKSGKVGEPHIIKISSRDTAPAPIEYLERSGGIFYDMATHDYDMARYLSGSEVVEVFAQKSVLIDEKIGEIGDYDTVVTTLKFESGAIAVIDNTRQCVYGYDHRVEVFGSKGCVRDENDITNTVHVHCANESSYDTIIKGMWDRYMPSFIAELISFRNAIVNGGEILVTAEDGMRAEIVAAAATKSAKEGIPVRIADLEF